MPHIRFSIVVATLAVAQIAWVCRAAAQGRREIELSVPRLSKEESMQGNGRVYAARFSPDHRHLWLARNQRLFDFDTREGKLSQQVLVQGPGLLHQLWFVASGKLMLVRSLGTGKDYCLLAATGSAARKPRWFDPSGQGCDAEFAGELGNGDLVFAYAERKKNPAIAIGRFRGPSGKLTKWTRVRPNDTVPRAVPIQCDLAIDRVGWGETLRPDRRIRYLLPRDAGAGRGVHLVAFMCSIDPAKGPTTSIRPMELTTEAGKLIPKVGAPWSFAGQPLAMHWRGEFAASHRQLGRQFLVRAHANNGRMAVVGRLGSRAWARGDNIRWHGNYLSAHDSPDGATRRSVPTAVRIASFTSLTPTIRLPTGKGKSSSVVAISSDGSHILTQTTIKEPPAEHSKWSLWISDSTSPGARRQQP